MADMQIDGSMGEGGGQVLRTALTLAMCLQQPIVVSNVRAGRAKPGLLRQHLAALKAAAEITDAQVEGATLGSTRIRFAPGGPRAGAYEFRIGSAGSTTLLVQTLLPVLALRDEPSTLIVHGGTHNGMAPSVDFVELALIPLLARIGIRVDSTLHQHGFYPNGGGRWELTIHPWRDCAAFEQTRRGALVSRQAVAMVSNLQMHVAERELDRVAKKLRWSSSELVPREVTASGPGNIVSLRCRFEGVTEVFEAVGALGVSAERVAGRAIGDARRYLAGSHALGEYLADQLLLPMVLGSGGEFTTGALSSHCRTNAVLINRMLGAEQVAFCTGESKTGPHSTLRISNGLALAR